MIFLNIIQGTMSVTSERVRKEFKAGDDIRDAGLCTPADVIRFDDILYGEDPVWQKLDVYRPASAEGKERPVIVSVHGGGWVYGDKERYQYYCMSLAQRGFAVINFTYRLAPEAKFPAPIEDTNLVFAWMLEHRQEYLFDTESVFAVGDSAGAHILGLYAAICTNPEYAARFDFRAPADLKLTAIGLNCGAFRISTDGEGDKQTRLLMEDFLPDKGTKEELDMIDVTKHITKDYPTVFCMTCTGDFLKDQAPLLTAKLAESDVPFLYRYYGDAEHILGHVFHCNMKSEYAAQFNDEQCGFFLKQRKE